MRRSTTLELTDPKTFAGGVAIHWYQVVRNRT
jgi:hypothetical protein